jgi:hypothetical protein
MSAARADISNQPSPAKFLQIEIKLEDSRKT